MSNNEPNYNDNLFIDSNKRERVYVYCSNTAENYIMEYETLEEAKSDSENWRDREMVIVGYCIENIYGV